MLVWLPVADLYLDINRFPCMRCRAQYRFYGCIFDRRPYHGHASVQTTRLRRWRLFWPPEVTLSFSPLPMNDALSVFLTAEPFRLSVSRLAVLTPLLVLLHGDQWLQCGLFRTALSFLRFLVGVHPEMETERQTDKQTHTPMQFFQSPALSRGSGRRPFGNGERQTEA